MAARGKSLTVTEVRTLSPRLRGITMAGPQLVGARFRAGDKVKLDVGGGRMRSYTPMWLDAERGTMEVVAVVHGHGPGSAWAEGARAGQRTTAFGPVGSMPAPDGNEAWAWFLGDETTVGLYRAIADALPDGTVVDGAIELDPSDAVALEALALQVRPALRRGAHGQALEAWMRTASVPAGHGTVWISGHAGAVESCQRWLSDRGVDPSRVRAKPYWNRKKDRLRGVLSFV